MTNSFLKLLQTTNSIYNVFIYAGKHEGFWSEVLRLVCRRDDIHLPTFPSMAKLKTYSFTGSNRMLNNSTLSLPVVLISLKSNVNGADMSLKTNM